MPPSKFPAYRPPLYARARCTVIASKSVPRVPACPISIVVVPESVSFVAKCSHPLSPSPGVPPNVTPGAGWPATVEPPPIVA
jgi:hypothetical protein